MAQTRKMRTRKQIYRSRVKTSPCRGQTADGCREKYGCKKTKTGNRKSYCRKRTNRRS